MSTMYVDNVAPLNTTVDGVHIPGHVVQVVRSSSATQLTATNIDTYTFLKEVAFTPKYNNSKLIITMNVGGVSNGGSGRMEVGCRVDTVSGGTTGTVVGQEQMGLPGAGTSHLGNLHGTYEYTVTSTNTLYIKMIAKKHDSTSTWYVSQYAGSYSGFVIQEIAQ